MPVKNTKSKLHTRSKHRESYDFERLVEGYPVLAKFVTLNKQGKQSINFFDPLAVKALNSALLKHFYQVEHWDIPEGYLCPPIPGRADYIHYIADLLAQKNKGVIPKGLEVRCLDIGVGANCIYPLIGAKEYGWTFVGVDVDAEAIRAAQNIVDANNFPKGQITLRVQPRKQHFFKNVIEEGERFDVSICNPPFHPSAEAAREVSARKLKNLSGKKTPNLIRNFGGTNHELWCKGGELRFIQDMINKSKYFAQSVNWFTTLVSQKGNVRIIYKALKKIHVKEIVVLDMGQGNKQSRIVAWRFY